MFGPFVHFSLLLEKKGMVHNYIRRFKMATYWLRKFSLLRKNLFLSPQISSRPNVFLNLHKPCSLSLSNTEWHK